MGRAEDGLHEEREVKANYSKTTVARELNAVIELPAAGRRAVACTRIPVWGRD